MTRILTKLGVVSYVRSSLLDRRNSQRRIRSVSQRGAGAVDANTDAANQVARADQQPAPEQRVASVVVAARVHAIAADLTQLGGEDNAHDDAVDGHDLAEDNGDQVLGANARGFDAAAEDRGAGDEDSPVQFVSAYSFFFCLAG